MKVDISKVKEGDLMAFVYWGIVKKKMQAAMFSTGNNELEIQRVDGNKKNTFYVSGNELIEQAHSADVISAQKSITKTDAAALLVTLYNIPFTVVFTKTDGEERKLRGRLVSPEPLLGRSMVEDLDITKGNRLRQVDHRTIKKLIVGGVEYTVK